MSDSADRREAGLGGPRSERGVALIMVMSFLALMLLLGLAVSMASITDLDVSTGTRLTMDAFNTAERGQTHAYELVRHMNGDFTCLLRGEDNEVKTGDEFKQWVSPVRAFSTSGSTYGDPIGPNLLDPMFGPQVETIDQWPTDGGTKTRAIKRVDARHFYELIVYDDANDPNSYLTDLRIELDADSRADPDKPALYNPSLAMTVDCDSRVLIRSIGYVMREDIETYEQFSLDKVLASSTIDSVIGRIAYPAVLVNGDLRVAGSSDVRGALGSVHANDDLTFTGNGYYIENTATWSNSDNTGSNPTFAVAGGHPSIVGYREPIPMRDLKPLDFGTLVDVIYLHRSASPEAKQNALRQLPQVYYSATDPDVITVNGAPIAGVSTTDMCLVRSPGSGTPTYTLHTVGAVGAPTGFTPSLNGDWSVNLANAGGDDDTNGKSYLVVTPVTTSRDGRITLSNYNSRRHLSVLTNGTIRLDGNVDIRPVLALPTTGEKVLLMAGADIYMRGNASLGAMTSWGLVYAHEQFDGQGSVTLNGQLFAFNQSLVPGQGSSTANSLVGENSISGSFTLNFAPSVGFVGAPALVSWRELRDFDPKDAYPPPAP